MNQSGVEVTKNVHLRGCVEKPIRRAWRLRSRFSGRLLRGQLFLGCGRNVTAE